MEKLLWFQKYQQDAATAVDLSNKTHRKLLDTIIQKVYKPSSSQTGKIYDAYWIGADLLTLRLLVNFIQTYERIFDRIVLECTNKFHGYLLPLVSINLTRLVLDVLSAAPLSVPLDGDISSSNDTPQSPQAVVEETYCIVFQLFEGLWQEKVGSIPKLPALIDSIKKSMQTTLTGTRKILISDFKRTLSDMTTFSKKKPASVQEKFRQLCADLKKLKFETDQEEIINSFKGIELLIEFPTDNLRSSNSNVPGSRGSLGSVTNLNEGNNKLSWNSVPEEVLDRALIPLSAEVHYSNDSHYKLIKACLTFMQFYSKKAKPDGPILLHKKLTVVNKATNKPLYYQLIYFFKRNNSKITDQTLSLIINYLAHPAHDPEFFKELISIGLFEELKQILSSGSLAISTLELLSKIQRIKLQRYIEMEQMPFDKTKPEHEKILKDIWVVSFPDVQLRNLLSTQWRLLGFMGDDPSADLKDMLAATMLHYFAKTYPETFYEISNRRGMLFRTDYHFAVLGIQLSQHFISWIQQILNSLTSTELFLRFLYDNPNTLEEMYCTLFKAFDALWSKASLGESNDTIILALKYLSDFWLYSVCSCTSLATFSTRILQEIDECNSFPPKLKGFAPSDDGPAFGKTSSTPPSSPSTSKLGYRNVNFENLVLKGSSSSILAVSRPLLAKKASFLSESQESSGEGSGTKGAPVPIKPKLQGSRDIESSLHYKDPLANMRYLRKVVSVAGDIVSPRPSPSIKFDSMPNTTSNSPAESSPSTPKKERDERLKRGRSDSFSDSEKTRSRKSSISSSTSDKRKHKK
eukprot:TRINITY_DN3170_c0_g1_i1.p1 TRINITY_DN3170_c0_g1~~TRINITY_DN3170_c0_g1_i1.p1  ORF type:complete len:804 (-),score=145.18 TRINITY_DN3170_c0_g1_i1:80-2491(-)